MASRPTGFKKRKEENSEAVKPADFSRKRLGMDKPFAEAMPRAPHGATGWAHDDAKQLVHDASSATQFAKGADHPWDRNVGCFPNSSLTPSMDHAERPPLRGQPARLEATAAAASLAVATPAALTRPVGAVQSAGRWALAWARLSKRSLQTRRCIREEIPHPAFDGSPPKAGGEQKDGGDCHYQKEDDLP